MMADSVELRISITSIKRVDPYVKQILATSTHVALYEFNPTANEWEKTDTEGALFLYSRNGLPYHSIMIMNRLNTNNLIEPIVKEFEYQMQAPFLLYRNSKSKIFGIWFYNRDECVNITALLESLTEALKEKMSEKAIKKENSVDIFSMLTKAQQDFNKTPNKTDVVQPQFSSTPRAPDFTSQSVMDFFAKAGSKSTQQPPATPGEGENLLQRLMSNPAHSVEHIEKQQRSITPQEHVQMRQKLNTQADRRSVPISFSNPTNADRNPENGLNLMRISSPQQPISGNSPLAALLMQSHNQIPDESEVLGTSPLAQLLETPHKPSLIPPIVFATSSSKEKSDMFSQNPDKMHNGVEPLTRNQMLQALTYLIKNDADFVTKLHEAYVKSLADLVNHGSSSIL